MRKTSKILEIGQKTFLTYKAGVVRMKVYCVQQKHLNIFKTLDKFNILV